MESYDENIWRARAFGSFVFKDVRSRMGCDINGIRAFTLRIRSILLVNYARKTSCTLRTFMSVMLWKFPDVGFPRTGNTFPLSNSGSNSPIAGRTVKIDMLRIRGQCGSTVENCSCTYS